MGNWIVLQWSSLVIHTGGKLAELSSRIREDIKRSLGKLISVWSWQNLGELFSKSCLFCAVLMCPVSEILPLFRILKPGSPRKSFWNSLVPLVLSYSQELLNRYSSSKMLQPQATTLISMNKKIQMNRQTFQKIYKWNENNHNLFLEIYSSYTKLGLLWRLDQSQCWSDWLLPSKLRNRELEVSLPSVTIWP